MKYVTSVLLGLLLTSCATPSQVYWDHKVKELCEKDGGVTVYEKVELTREERDSLRIVPASKVTNKDDYYWEDSQEIFNESPRVIRFTGLLFRNSDKKIIAKQIDYSRVGGDVPTGISHPSSYNCDQAGVSTQVSKLIFFVNGD